MDAPDTHAPIQRFSTSGLPAKLRFDYYLDVLKQSLWQVTDWDQIPKKFDVEFQATSLDCLTVAKNEISSHHSHRTKADVERSSDRNYHLFVSTTAAWAFTHNGQHERLEVGDVVMFGEGEHETHAPEGFNGVIVKCPERWLQTWLSDPAPITGHSMRRDSKWGRVLSPMLQQLTPQAVASMTLPQAIVADQLGSVLALMLGELQNKAMPDFLKKVEECLRHRCGDLRVTASDVATWLGVPTADLHKVLIAGNTTFAAELRRARIRCGVIRPRKPK